MSKPADELIEAARRCSQNAHGPYSGIRVGAAVRSVSGQVYAGCNVENASFPLGNCAEASAIAIGVATEGAAFSIAEVAVYAERVDGVEIAAPPCGGCRQRIREFAADDRVPVHFRAAAGRQSLGIGELLPYSFEFPPAMQRG